MRQDGSSVQEKARRHWRQLAAIGVLAGVAATAGCSTSSTSSETASPSPSASQPNNYPTVDIGTLPEHLPAAVARVLGSTVSLEFRYTKTQTSPDGRKSDKVINDDVASGTRVAKNLYLSAGHLVKDGIGDTYRPGINACNNLTVLGPSKLPFSVTTPGNRTFSVNGSTLFADRLTGTYKNVTSGIGDAALIHAPDTYGELPGQSVARVAPKPLQIGDDVYFGNYQPAPDGEYRSPSEFQVLQLNNTVTSNPELTKPAVFGGVVIGHEGGDLEVAVNLRSYDKLRDNYFVGGGSGGGVLDAEGELGGIGVDAEALPLGGEKNFADLEKDYHVHFTGVPKDSAVGVALVQPFTPFDLSNMEHDLSLRPACTPAH